VRWKRTEDKGAKRNWTVVSGNQVYWREMRLKENGKQVRNKEEVFTNGKLRRRYEMENIGRDDEYDDQTVRN
jgi:hypothetical protein